MKTTTLFLAIYLVANCSSRVMAQTDSLTVADTISVRKQPTLFGPSRMYRYHLASQLMSIQLAPLLKRSTDDKVQQYYRRYKTFTTIRRVAGLAFWGSWITVPFTIRTRPELSGALFFGGLGISIASLFLPIERSMERAVRQHNASVRGQSGDYFQPVVGLLPQTGPLTLADTVERQKRGQFWYRGVRVDPVDNLRLAFDRLNNGRLNGNMKYVRTGRNISGFAGGFASGLLSTYLFTYALRRANGSRFPADQTLIYSAAAVIGASIAYNFHLSRVQVGTVEEYNKRLREAIRGEEQERP